MQFNASGEPVLEGRDIKKLPIEKRARFAAYLSATHNMSQAEIGRVLGGLSQPHVSRLLAHATKTGYLVVEHRFRMEKVAEDEQRELAALLTPSTLSQALTTFCTRHDKPVPGLGVFESGRGTTDGAMALRRKRFGKTAAGRVIELLGGQRIAGVAWGRTLRCVVEGIETSHLPLSAMTDVEFVPVCAELLMNQQRETSANRLAEALTRTFHPKGRDVQQLTGFPAYVAGHYDDMMQKAAWRLIRDTPNYESILSGPEAFVSRMNILLTSVGYAEALVRGGHNDLLRAGRIDPIKLQGLVVGDLGGLLIPRPSLNASQSALVDELNEMWTGISLKQVSEIAARAHCNADTSGVVVLALRAERAGTLLELVRLGLANHLIIDQDVADALELRLLHELDETA